SATFRPRTSRSSADSSGPVRIFGPCRSPRIATGRPTASAAAFTSAAAWRCVSWSPCEKLSLATSMPAWTMARRTAGAALEGPMVQTIRVRRIMGSTLVTLDAAREFLLRLAHLPLQLQSAEHRAAGATDQVPLESVGGGDGDHVPGLGSLVGDPLDGVVC